MIFRVSGFASPADTWSTPTATPTSTVSLRVLIVMEDYPPALLIARYSRPRHFATWTCSMAVAATRRPATTTTNRYHPFTNTLDGPSRAWTCPTEDGGGFYLAHAEYGDDGTCRDVGWLAGSVLDPSNPHLPYDIANIPIPPDAGTLVPVAHYFRYGRAYCLGASAMSYVDGGFACMAYKYSQWYTQYAYDAGGLHTSERPRLRR